MPKMAYKGKYRPKNLSKYRGDAEKVTYRSLWELRVFKWMDENSSIKWWSSEETVVPYVCKTDGKRHRYYIDITFSNLEGRVYLIEIKPKSQTIPPPKPKRITHKYKEQVMTYAKNISKWEAADRYASERGMIFETWTEDTLKSLGIRMLTK